MWQQRISVSGLEQARKRIKAWQSESIALDLHFDHGSNEAGFANGNGCFGRKAAVSVVDGIRVNRRSSASSPPTVAVGGAAMSAGEGGSL